MALNSSSRTQLTQQLTEKSSSPFGKLKKMLSGAKTPPEASFNEKKPAMKSREKTTTLSSSTGYHESLASSAASPSSAPMTITASDDRFPPLVSSYAALPASIDWRHPLQTPASSSSGVSSTTIPSPTAASVPVLAIAFPPAKQVSITPPTSDARTSHPPAQESLISAPQSTPFSSPRTTTSSIGAPASSTEKTLSITSTSRANGGARQLFSALEKNIEHLLWHPSPSSYQQLRDTMKQIDASGLDFTDIDASSLVLRILVDPGKENLDPVIDWIAKLGCPLISNPRKLDLNRSSVLERAVRRGWTKTVDTIAAELDQKKMLRDHTENMLARAMQSDKTLSLLERAFQFSADYCPLTTRSVIKMISALGKAWQSDPDNALHRAKFIALFHEAERHDLDPLPVATMLQVATKFHHAAMALTMLQLNANPNYLDEDGKTVTDLALEAQQRLMEAIEALRTRENDMDPVHFQTEMSEHQRCLGSNQRILDALDAINSSGSVTASSPSE